MDAIETLVGPNHVGCWELVREIFLKEQGVDLPADYFRAIETSFRPAHNASRGVVVVMKMHAVITNHCGYMLDEKRFIHSTEKAGVTINTLDDAEWMARVAKTSAGKLGFLRLRA